MQGRIQDFKLGGAHLKKLRRAEGGAKICGVFRVKNHDFTPKNQFQSLVRTQDLPHYACMLIEVMCKISKYYFVYIRELSFLL
jgi:hypothetical protein